MKYECHGHIIADGVSYQEAMARHKGGIDAAYVHKALKTVAAHGIGFYRDGGDKYMVSAFAKKIAGEYGVDYRTPVFISHKAGYYGSMYGRSFENMREFHALILEAKAQGADFVKLTVSGMLDFDDGGRIMGPVFSGPELREAVKISNGEGFSVMAHVNGADNIKAALEAGVDSVEHGFWPDGDVIDYFLQTGAVWVPTCVAVYNLIDTGRYSGDTMRKIHEAQRRVLAEAYARGVPIASGSDCGAWMVRQGQGTDDELAVLAGMGIDPEKGNRAVAERFRRL
ncbi:Amidohydrolase family protein [Sporobacter termitidis DSM 10068]|uniref:Amidohydrolase family protein n=1 Tax=Sporobacter termitidis DSM 10068 TaxID=1123282 RepID=A0A1M5X4F6_9FIRM|nr:amidohydrolase family protein [Sporobacter termitidis]SHH94404.1 Amidohydrolase family protein [Sporobacter termitidis DSM 10068]